VSGRDIAAVAGDVERRLNEIEFPLEYRAELLESAAQRMEARNRALSSALTAAVGMYLILQACVGSWSLATVMVLTIPASLAGGVAAAIAYSGTLSLGVVIGLIAVLGVALRNSLALIKRYRLLAAEPGDARLATNVPDARGQYDPRSRLQWAAREEAAVFGPGVVQAGSWERFTPVLMTAFITAAAVLPLALMGEVPGNEVLVRPVRCSRHVHAVHSPPRSRAGRSGSQPGWRGRAAGVDIGEPCIGRRSAIHREPLTNSEKYSCVVFS
jgi:Cu/Ag efflux pump CusA